MADRFALKSGRSGFCCKTFSRGTTIRKNSADFDDDETDDFQVDGEVAQFHKLKPELIARRKDLAMEDLECHFQCEDRWRQDRIAELGRMVGA